MAQQLGLLCNFWFGGIRGRLLDDWQTDDFTLRIDVSFNFKAHFRIATCQQFKSTVVWLLSRYILPSSTQWVNHDQNWKMSPVSTQYKISVNHDSPEPEVAKVLFGVQRVASKALTWLSQAAWRGGVSPSFQLQPRAPLPVNRTMEVSSQNIPNESPFMTVFVVLMGDVVINSPHHQKIKNVQIDNQPLGHCGKIWRFRSHSTNQLQMLLPRQHDAWQLSLRPWDALGNGKQKGRPKGRRKSGWYHLRLTAETVHIQNVLEWKILKKMRFPRSNGDESPTSLYSPRFYQNVHAWNHLNSTGITFNKRKQS